MAFNKDDYKIEVFSGINSNVIPPSPNKAGNGSHLISKINGLVDELETHINFQQNQINELIANSGGKANWIIATDDYNANFNDSIFIPSLASGLTITLPSQASIGSYIQIIKSNLTTEVYLEKDGNDKINDSYSWSSVRLMNNEESVYLIWTGNDSVGWQPIKKNAFDFIEQQA